MTILIDSGSSKTSWAALHADRQLIQEWQTIGINPYQQSQVSIKAGITANFPLSVDDIHAVYYYGAGADEQQQERLKATLQDIFKKSQTVDVQSDIVAVAHALCGNEKGIVGIIGTGSNSAVYDGSAIIDNIGGFGFIVGDEGSGAVLGKQLMNQYLHRQLSPSVTKALENRYALTPTEVVEKVYKGDYPNRFLAGFAPFLHEFQHELSIKTLINMQFRAFFEQKIMCYEQAKQLPIHLAGSIAYYFEPIIRNMAKEYDLTIGRVVQHPMPDLIQYHQRQN
jgi:N-acetylglucosamine kinase-like BadF-type ATPase